MRQTSNQLRVNTNSHSSSAAPATNWPLAARKAGLSLLVILGFAGYAYRDHFGITPDGAASAAPAAAPASAPAAPVAAQPEGPVSAAVPAASATSTTNSAAAQAYKDGTFTGPAVDAYYGNVQVEAIIQGGKITQVKFLDYPHDRRTSQMINNQAMPWLNSEAITAQSAQVDIISGATFTSEGFQQSLQAALTQAGA